MDNVLIKSLIDALEASTLSELEYSRDGVTLRLVKGCSLSRAQAALSVASVAPLPALQPQAAAPQARVVVAPLFGIVHLWRSPGAPPLVAAGQTVEAGQLLCLIEAMKMFTEMRAERDGTVAEILIDSGQEVEAGRPILRWE